jgi:transcriptional regulator with XRE-family HTH domain
MANAELARLLGVSEAWTTRRLGKRADTVLNLADLQRIAAALDTPLTTFFTAEIRESVPPAIAHYFEVAERTSDHHQRPPDNRPSGRPAAGAAATILRTAHLPRSNRRRRDR